jgi:hypothetical protein
MWQKWGGHWEKRFHFNSRRMNLGSEPRASVDTPMDSMLPWHAWCLTHMHHACTHVHTPACTGLLNFTLHLWDYYCSFLALRLLFAWQDWDLNSGLYTWEAGKPPLEPHLGAFCSGYFEDGVLWTFCLSWPWTTVLLISASQAARISGVSHRCLTHWGFLK